MIISSADIPVLVVKRFKQSNIHKHTLRNMIRHYNISKRLCSFITRVLVLSTGSSTVVGLKSKEFESAFVQLTLLSCKSPPIRISITNLSILAVPQVVPGCVVGYEY